MAEGSKRKGSTDKAMNVGRSVKLSDRVARVHQLRWRSVKAVTRDLYDLAMEVKEKNPGVDWTDVKPAEAVEIVFNSLLSAVDSSAAIVERLLADASDVSVEELEELTLSDFQKLLAAALEEQAEVLADFFALRATVGVLLARSPSSPTGRSA